MINTFKPYVRIIKRTKTKVHDWFALSIYGCNMLQLSISIYGYGLTIGILLYDVLKGDE
jgi:hypothetical protein